MSVGDKVLVHGKNSGVITSVHNNGKRVGFKLDCGKTSFTLSRNVKVVTDDD
jgi:hypothetical protein